MCHKKKDDDSLMASGKDQTPGDDSLDNVVLGPLQRSLHVGHVAPEHLRVAQFPAFVSNQYPVLASQPAALVSHTCRLPAYIIKVQ